MDLTNITATIRVDTATQLGSVMDVIAMVDPGNPSLSLSRLIKGVPDLIEKCKKLKINGKGNVTPVADAKTLIEIVWLLPGKAAREFRRTSAKTVCRVLGGDLSLAEEIEAHHHAQQGSDEGQAAQALMLADSDDSDHGFPVAKRMKSSLPDELQLATAEQRSAYYDCWMVQRGADRKMELQKRQFDNTLYFLSEMRRQSILDPALRVVIIDNLKKILCQDATSPALAAIADLLRKTSRRLRVGC
ncbi:hypothetical protein JKP88DRAFT_242225 [Tribonema minus]|uniref:Uncharacterized protein n=1 Tax=Tribonema minus TaxID=303371 RepID=A0A835YUW0_9STRA|nr:hypothetical protein JKP88DRAFT_242225 [Tribonema minus]